MPALSPGRPGQGANLNSHPLRLNVGFLLHEGIGYNRTFDFDHPNVRVGDDLDVDALRGSIRMTRAVQGLYAHGRLTAMARAECVRCLEAYGQPLEIELDDLFVYPSSKATEPLLSVPETGLLDLSPLVREYLLLDFPIQPLCRPDCRGLCPECGANLNETTCGHAQAPTDSDRAPLRASQTES
ncbi:MAG TPA: DUF177 domain-containing protein [Anaerolineales bacterium]|nr:DUF177 domain-containing protein [Anaerolineales bacterium]